MNLYDLVKRNDFYLDAFGQAESVIYRSPSEGNAYSGVRLGKKSKLQLVSTQTIYEIRSFPENPSWLHLFARPETIPADGSLIISIETDDGSTHCLYKSRQTQSCVPSPISFDWPSQIPREFSLVLSNTADTECLILTSQIYDKRILLSHCKGTGLEFGPGLKPHVLPSSDVKVRYIEQTRPREWQNTYNKKSDTSIPIESEELYIFGDISIISSIIDYKVDFIYSNHVIEHLLNPISVIKDSLKLLHSGKPFLGALPSAPNTFDLRQTPTTLDDLIFLEQEQYTTIPYYCYERWVKYTERRATVESLVSRNYSVHITYWTLGLVEELCNLLDQQGLISRYEIIHPQNCKDIVFILHSA